MVQYTMSLKPILKIPVHIQILLCRLNALLNKLL